VSGNLADRAALRAELEEVRADVFLVELKAAAVDVVAEHALTTGAEVVLASNDVLPLPGQADLDEMLLEMARIGL
jgi:cyclic 2,3-diphosphoglycerate synthase